MYRFVSLAFGASTFVARTRVVALVPGMADAPSLLQTFKENPFPFALVVLIACVGLLTAFVALVLAFKRSAAGVLTGMIAVGFGLLAVCGGLGGFMLWRARVYGAVGTAGLGASDRSRMLEYGLGEAKLVAYFGLAVGAIVIVAGASCAALARARRAGRA